MRTQLTEKDRAKRTDEIRESLSALKGIAIGRTERDSGAALAEYIEELRHKLSSQDVYLAVLGLFKRGKSTLINALLQSDTLPSGVVPVTSVITKIKYSELESAKILFRDGSTKEIPVPELVTYITEKGNPGNTKAVREAEVGLPSSFLKDSGITIIDTPGVGSTYLSGTKATYEFLERIDAALFVLAVDPPIGKEEAELLKATKPYAKKFTFVLNKKDYVKADALDEALSFCRGVIQSSLALEEVSIYTTSARLALEGYITGDYSKITQSGITELKAAMNKLLRDGRQEILVASIASKALRVAEDLSISQEIAIKSAGMPLGTLEQTLRTIEDFLESIESKKREIFYLLDGKSKETVQTLDDDLERFKLERRSEFVSMMESYANGLLASDEKNPRQMTSEVENRLKESLRETYSRFISSESTKIDNKFAELADAFANQAESVVAEIRRKMSSLFGIDIEGPARGIGLTTEHEFHFRIDSLFPSDPMLTSEVTMLLPKFVLRGTILKKTKERAEQEFDSTAGRIRYDYFIVRLDKGLIELKRDLRRTLDASVLAAKEAVIQGGEIRRQSQEEIGKRLNEMEGTLKNIRRIKSNLEGTLQSPDGASTVGLPLPQQAS